MKNEEWLPFETEEILDKDGNLISKKITSKKIMKSANGVNYLDISLKLLGGIAIFIPIFLIYLQRRNSITLEKNKQLSETFVNYTHKINSFDKLLQSDILNDSIITSLEIEYPTKFLVFGNRILSKKSQEIIELEKMHYQFSRINNFINSKDSLLKSGTSYLKEAGNGRSLIYNKDSITFFHLLNDSKKDSNLTKLNIAFGQLGKSSQFLKRSDSASYEFFLLKADTTLKICNSLIFLTTNQYISLLRQPLNFKEKIDSHLNLLSLTMGYNQFIRDKCLPYLNDLYLEKKSAFTDLIYSRLDN